MREIKLLQSILSAATLRIMEHLLERRLTNVDVNGALKMLFSDIITHRCLCGLLIRPA